MSTVKCKNCTSNMGVFCWNDLWSQDEDKWLKDEKELEEHINAERVCSEFSQKNADKSEK